VSYATMAFFGLSINYLVEVVYFEN
jgi:hypothetical protein